jgi:hypothetical protein
MHNLLVPLVVDEPTGPRLVEAARLRLLSDLAPTLRLMEVRHGIASSMLAEAIADGRLPVTDEVTGWLIAWDRFEAILAVRTVQG